MRKKVGTFLNKISVALLLFASLNSLVFGEAVQAAQIRCVVPDERPCVSVILEGEITSGDERKFIGFIGELLTRDGLHHLHTLYLNSPGGNIIEATQIGQVVRELWLQTQSPMVNNNRRSMYLLDERYLGPSVGRMRPLRRICFENNCECSSACFLIWAAGIKREGNHFAVHRPSVGTQHLWMPSLGSSVNFLSFLKRHIEQYLELMDVPRMYFNRMYEASPREIVEIVTFSEDQGAFRVTGWITPLQDALSSSCSFLSSQEMDEFWNRITDTQQRNSASPSSPQASMQRHQELISRHRAASLCVERYFREEAPKMRAVWMETQRIAERQRQQ